MLATFKPKGLTACRKKVARTYSRAYGPSSAKYRVFQVFLIFLAPRSHRDASDDPGTRVGSVSQVSNPHETKPFQSYSAAGAASSGADSDPGGRSISDVAGSASVGTAASTAAAASRSSRSASSRSTAICWKRIQHAAGTRRDEAAHDDVLFETLQGCHTLPSHSRFSENTCGFLEGRRRNE